MEYLEVPSVTYDIGHDPNLKSAVIPQNGFQIETGWPQLSSIPCHLLRYQVWRNHQPDSPRMLLHDGGNNIRKVVDFLACQPSTLHQVHPQNHLRMRMPRQKLQGKRCEREVIIIIEATMHIECRMKPTGPRFQVSNYAVSLKFEVNDST